MADGVHTQAVNVSCGVNVMGAGESKEAGDPFGNVKIAWKDDTAVDKDKGIGATGGGFSHTIHKSPAALRLGGCGCKLRLQHMCAFFVIVFG